MHTIALSLPRNELTITKAHLIIEGMEYVSVEEASDISDYAIQYIRRCLRQGKIRGVKKSKVWWVELESLREYKRTMDELGNEKFSPNK